MTLPTKEANLLLTSFVILFFFGFLLANSLLICASVIPLFIYLSAVFIAPLKVQTKKTGFRSSARLGEILELKIIGKITGGPGAVVIWDEVPPPYQLIEGSNYRVISKNFAEKVFSFSYKMQCTKCGNYMLGSGWETRHILGLTQTQFSIEEEIRQLSVFPVLPKIRKVRLPVGRTQRIQPGGSISKIGPLSTDFKEIRNYFYGDPFKIINWKASAKAAGRGNSNPLVNEYEREGKLPIWLFLDANPRIISGTSIENTLEYCIRAAYIISHYFLSKGYSLGMYIYNHRGETFHIDTGKRQFIKIGDGLLKLTAPKVGLQVFWDEGFSKAVKRNRKRLITQSPRVIIITHIIPSNWNDLLNGLLEILAYRRGTRQLKILMINILPYDVWPKTNDEEIFAAKILDEASRSFSNQLRNSLGLTVLDLNLQKENIEPTLLSNIRLR